MDENKIKKGTWGEPTLANIPGYVKELLQQLKNDPKTDWIQSGEWLIARLYVDEDIGDYVVCKVVHEEEWKSK